MEVCPLGGEVERQLGVVVGHQLLAGHLDHRRHGDAAGVAGEPGEVGLLQPLVAQHRVDAARVEVECPAPAVVGRPAQAHRDHLLQAQQPADDDRPAGPRAGPGRDQAIAAGLDRIAVPPVPGDPGGDVVGVALVLGSLLHVGAPGRVRGFGRCGAGHARHPSWRYLRAPERRAGREQRDQTMGVRPGTAAGPRPRVSGRSTAENSAVVPSLAIGSDGAPSTVHHWPGRVYHRRRAAGAGQLPVQIEPDPAGGVHGHHVVPAAVSHRAVGPDGHGLGKVAVVRTDGEHELARVVQVQFAALGAGLRGGSRTVGGHRGAGDPGLQPQLGTGLSGGRLGLSALLLEGRPGVDEHDLGAEHAVAVVPGPDPVAVGGARP